MMLRCRLILLLLVALAWSGRLAAQGRALPVTEELRTNTELSMVLGMAVDSSGTIAVNSWKEEGILFFDRTGHALKRFGRQGGGPGEFVRLGQIGEWAGGFFADDPMGARVTLLTHERTLQKVIPLRDLNGRGTSHAASGFPMAEAVRSVDSFLVHGDPPNVDGKRPKGWGIGLGGARYYATSADGGMLKLLMEVPASPTCSVEWAKGSARVPLCAEVHWAIASDASRLVVVVPSYPQRASYRVTVVAWTGDTVLSREISFKPALIPSHIVDSVIAPLLKNPEYARTISRPRIYPPVERVIVGRDGTIWIEEHEATGRHRWLVLDPTGKTLGTVMLPENVKLFVADGTHLWGVIRDEDDVESVVRYRVGGS